MSGPFQSIYHRTKRQAERRKISPRSESDLPDSTETRFETELAGEGGVEIKCTSHKECQVRCYLKTGRLKRSQFSFLFLSSKNLEKMFYFFTYILIDYLVHEITKEF